MDASCESRWPGTADPQILTTVAAAAVVAAEEEEAVEEGRPGGTAAMDAGAEALPPAQDTEDAAGPAAGAALVPEADPATADPGPGPTPDPSLTLPGTRRLRPNPSLVPDLDPGPGPSPSPGQEAAPPPLKEGPDRDLKASLSPQQKMEGNPHRAQHKFSGEDWKLQVQDRIQRKQQCCAVKGYYCVFHALICFIHLATKGFVISLMCCDSFFFFFFLNNDFKNLIQCEEAVLFLHGFVMMTQDNTVKFVPVPSEEASLQSRSL